MAINSRRKGATGELEFAHKCEEYGFEDCYRTAQHTGKLPEASADCVGLPGIHIEVKRVEKLNIDNAVEQSVRDAEIQNKGNIPVVFHRKNRKPWLATMTLDNWMKIYKSHIKQNNLDKKE